MKILHWTFVFIAIILPISIVCRNTVNSRFSALKDEVRINNAIDTATKDAIDQIITVSGFDFDYEFGDVINITPALAQETINTFFHTLAINYNIPYKVSDATKIESGNSQDSYIKNYFASYVPAIVIVAYDGFYIYSQEYFTDTVTRESGYRYELSSKIPYTKEFTYDNGTYSIGYTLGEDIYLYVNEECYSGRLKYNNFQELEAEYLKYYDEFTTNEIAGITSDISMVLYSLQYDEDTQPINKVMFDECILPAEGTNNFLQDYIKDNTTGEYSIGKFHETRRKVIIDIITDCLNEEFNEQNRFADLVGNTYDFYLPEITESDWINTINDISILSFVQGIPVGTTEGVYYNSYALGGSQIVQREYLYGNTQYSEYLAKDVLLYHYHDCIKVNKDEDRIFIDEEDACEAGYKPCQLCN